MITFQSVPSMSEPELTPGEIKRSLDRIECDLAGITESLEALSGKVVSDYYQLRDHEIRLTRLERAGVAIASAVALAILAAIIQLVL